MKGADKQVVYMGWKKGKKKQMFLYVCVVFCCARG